MRPVFWSNSEMQKYRFQKYKVGSWFNREIQKYKLKKYKVGK